MPLPRPLPRLRARLAERRALREPSGFRIAIADSIDQLDPARWDAIAAAPSCSWFFSRAYLAMLESVPPDAVEPRYALVSDAGGPVALVVMQWAEVEGHRLRPLPRERGLEADDDADDERGPLRRLASGLSRPARRAFATHLRERVLVCGNLLTYGPHAVAVADDVDPAAVWPAVAEVLYRVRRAEKLAGQAGFVLVKDVLVDRPGGIERLRGLSYRAVETEPNMVLAIDAAWRTHADYLGTLTSKYRSAVKNQILAPIQKAGLEVRRFVPGPAPGAAPGGEPAAAADTASLAARLHALYLAVHENASLRPFTLHAGYFAALAGAAGERVRFAGVFEGETLLGFIVTLRDTAQAIAYHVGFDHARAVDLPIYLRLLHASIEDAIELGATELSFGRTALEPKSRLGAKAQPLQVWLRHRQPVFNQLVTRLVGFAHHAEPPECHPFKKAVAGPDDGTA
jgi:hypothetical protein